eukprot:Polyplicarium_translucidae@DN1521_c1_g1_i2.p1
MLWVSGRSFGACHPSDVTECLAGRGILLSCEKDINRAAVLVSRIRRTGLVGPFVASTSGFDSVDPDAEFLGSVVGQFLFFRDPEATFPASLVVAVVVGDFLQLKAQSLGADGSLWRAHDGAFRAADVILADPSCSGSGLPTHADSRTADPARLRKLAAFQLRILRHAVNEFSARRIIYSTCSIQHEENEAVVSRVLAEGSRFEAVDAIPHLSAIFPSPLEMPEMLRRVARLCLHFCPTRDRCRGFFLTKLEAGVSS